MIIAAHGNSIRALVKYLDNVSDQDIVELNIPTGIPLVYELDDALKPLRHYYLGDQEKIAAAVNAVAAQGKARLSERWQARPGLLLLALAGLPGRRLRTPGRADQLKELRGRIDRLQKQLTESEETRIRGRRRAARVRARHQRREPAPVRAGRPAARSERNSRAGSKPEVRRSWKAREAQQALLAKLLYQQYLSGQPEPLRLVLNRQDPNEIARADALPQLHLTCPRRADRSAARAI